MGANINPELIYLHNERLKEELRVEVKLSILEGPPCSKEMLITIQREFNVLPLYIFAWSHILQDVVCLGAICTPQELKLYRMRYAGIF